MKTQKIEYQDENTTLVGYVAYDDRKAEKKPVVLVVHDWTGRNPFAERRAERLAELGYIGFAIDMYGNGKNGSNKEEKTALIQPFMQNRANLQKRILAAFETAKKLEHADTSRIGAIGFCFGGLCALDLARSGADVKGVVSFHGLLDAPDNVTRHQIKAKMLVLHGYDDPMVSPEKVVKFASEMTEAKVDWQLDIYGNTMHGFTNPEANDPGFGTVYSKSADSRSWIAMIEFFRETFGK